jgi:ubiquinone/menaquinone biosynthesis C-methylase UbiE
MELTLSDVTDVSVAQASVREAMGYQSDASSYDRIADWYATWVKHGSPIHDVVLSCIRELVGPVSGQRICDVGCGEGVVARMLASRGAKVTGIDVSTRLLSHAEQRERSTPLGIRYLREDAQKMANLPDCGFDGIVSSLALTDIPDLTATTHEIFRVLRPAGFFVFAINHPCGPSSGLKGTLDYASHGYFEEGFWRSSNPESVRGRVGAYHRRVSTYLEACLASGMVLEHMMEPQGTERLANVAAGYQHAPCVLAIRCRKPRA